MGMADRYIVEKGSRTAHCCFVATVVDTHETSSIGALGLMCECFSEEDARTIAEALNQHAQASAQDTEKRHG